MLPFFRAYITYTVLFKPWVVVERQYVAGYRWRAKKKIFKLNSSVTLYLRITSDSTKALEPTCGVR